MKILIVKTSAIGDIIHTFPVVDYLRHRFPKAEIDWVVEKGNRALVSAHPEIHKVYSVDTQTWRKGVFTSSTWQQIKAFKSELAQTSYDLLFDLQGNTKSAFITFFANAKEKIGFGWDTVKEKPNMLVTTKRYSTPPGMSVRKRNLHLVKSYLGELHQLPRKTTLTLTSEEQARLDSILIHSITYMVAFGSKWTNKRLSVDVLQEFLLKLSANFMFVWSTPEEKIIAEKLAQSFPNSTTLGDLTLPLWQAIMQKVDCVIAMDSAALHLCATTSTPTFSVFGPSLASIFKPDGEQHVAIQGTCPYNKTFAERCPILRTCKTGACIRNITADQLFESFKKLTTISPYAK